MVSSQVNWNVWRHETDPIHQGGMPCHTIYRRQQPGVPSSDCSGLLACLTKHSKEYAIIPRKSHTIPYNTKKGRHIRIGLSGIPPTDRSAVSYIYIIVHCDRFFPLLLILLSNIHASYILCLFLGKPHYNDRDRPKQRVHSKLV